MYRALAVLGFLAIMAASAALTFGALRLLRSDPGETSGRSSCPHRIPVGSGIAAVQRTTTLFATEVLLRRNPSCGYELSSARLRERVNRGQWAREETPVRPFATRYPPVAYADASANPEAPQAVYLVSRRLRDFVEFRADGRAQIPMSIGVAAPDAGMGAYRLLLVLDEGNWRVDRWWRVRVSSTDY